MSVYEYYFPLNQEVRVVGNHYTLVCEVSRFSPGQDTEYDDRFCIAFFQGFPTNHRRQSKTSNSLFEIWGSPSGVAEDLSWPQQNYSWYICWNRIMPRIYL